MGRSKGPGCIVGLAGHGTGCTESLTFIGETTYYGFSLNRTMDFFLCFGCGHQEMGPIKTEVYHTNLGEIGRDTVIRNQHAESKRRWLMIEEARARRGNTVAGTPQKGEGSDG